VDDGRDTRVATARLVLFSSALAGLAVVLWSTQLAGLPALPGDHPQIPIAVFVLAFAAAELVSVHIETRGEAHALTFSEIPFVLGLLFAAPEELILARVVSGLFVLAVVRRQSWHKLYFNLSLFAAEIALGATVYRELLGSSDPASVAGWVPAFVALLAASMLDFTSVTIAISIYSGWPGRRLVGQVFLFGTLCALANTSTGLALAVSIWDRSYTGLLIVAVIAALYILYRAYMGLNERHKNLEHLHDFTRSLGDASEIEDLEEAVARGAREILRGEQVALLLPPVRDGVAGTR
jgi:hypothetical protein